MFVYPKIEEYISRKKEKKRVKVNKITKNLERSLRVKRVVLSFSLSNGIADTNYQAKIKAAQFKLQRIVSITSLSAGVRPPTNTRRE